MADQQPSPAPAPDGTTPQGTPPAPAAQPAGDQAAQSISFDTFSEDDKKYLAGQGITSQEQLTQEALVKVINHARSSQKTAAEIKAENDRIKQSINPTPATPDPFSLPTTPSSTTQPTGDNPAPSATPAPQGQPQGVDRVSMFNLATSLATQFPRLKDQLSDGSFYTSMQELGIPLTNGGQLNLDNVLKYAKFADNQADTAEQLAKLNAPDENKILDANPSSPQTPQQPAADAPMTKQMALAIAQFTAAGNTHPRSDEAKQFLQK